jgi:hypothetical protein
MGNAETMEHHAGYGCARREHFLVLRHETSVDQVNEASVFDHSSQHTAMIEAFNAHRFPAGLLPCIALRALDLQGRINGVFSLSTCSMSVISDTLRNPATAGELIANVYKTIVQAIHDTSTVGTGTDATG